MDVSRALDQIAEIHEQLAKGEVYRGYRSLPVAISGLIGFVAAWLQPTGLGTADPIEFLTYWLAIGASAGALGGSEIAWNYLARENAAERRRTRQVIGQFLPSLIAGGLLAISFMQLGPALVTLVPGLWALCFGLGIFASRPYLPRASGWVALFYYAAAFVLLGCARSAVPLSGWWVGGTFGVGQLLAALVLWYNLERD